MNQDPKDLASKPADATSPTEALDDAMKPVELGNAKPRDLCEVLSRILMLIPEAPGWRNLRQELRYIHDTVSFQPPEAMSGWWQRAGSALHQWLGEPARDSPPWVWAVVRCFSGDPELRP